MKEINKTSLGYVVPVKIYESPEEADKDAGRVGAFAEEANNNLYYRAGCAQEARETIAETVEKLTGVKRETSVRVKKVTGEDGFVREEQIKDSDGNILTEFVHDEDAYVKLALATAKLTVETTQSAVTDAIRKSNEGQGIRVDIRKKERKASGPKTLPEKYRITAVKLLETGKVKQFAADYRKTLGRELSDEQKKDATAVGWALKEFFAAREAEYTK